MGSRPNRRPDRRAVAASVVVHVAVIGGMLVTGIGARAAPPPFEVYEVDLVSPPAREAGPPEPVVAEPEPPPVETPEPVEPEPEPEPEQPPEPEPEPEPTPPKAERPETPTPTPPEPVDSTETAPTPKTEAPDSTSPVAGEDLNVKLEGEAFAYPAYLENIIRQVNRYFRWTGASGLEAEISFVILRDGSVEDIQLLRGSGNITFNLEAMAAVEQAGNRGAFGALPDGFQGDRLPISFYFRPAGR